MNKLSVANALACEFTIAGLNNKHTAANIYAGDILVQSFPAQIAMAFYIELMPNFSATIPGKISVHFAGTVLAQIDADFSLERGNPNILLLPQAMLTLPKAGKIKIMIELEGHKPLTALTKSIKLL